MKPFTYVRPADARAAIAAAGDGGASFLAGGTTLVDLMRLEVMTPIDLRPCRSWIPRSRAAAKPSASSQLTSRHGSAMVSRIIGIRIRSLWLV